MATIIELDAERAAKDKSFAPLPISLNIEAGIDACVASRAIFLIRTPPGYSKTYTCRRAHAKHPVSTVFLTLNPACASFHGGLAAFARALVEHLDRYQQFGRLSQNFTDADLRGTWRPRTGWAIEEVMRAAARRLGDDVLTLIVDEAQHGSVKLLDYLRSLYDLDLCSLVIAGNDSFAMEGLEPLISRARYEIVIDMPSERDVIAFAEHNRIVAPRSVEVLRCAAAARGIRGAAEALRRAQIADGKDVPSLAALEDAFRSMTLLLAPSGRQRKR